MRFAGSLVLVALPVLISCTDERGRPVVGPSCQGDECVPPPTSGGGPTGAGGGGVGGGSSGVGGGGGIGPGDLSGTIGVLVDEAFSQAQPYVEACAVVATAPNAMTVTATCDKGTFGLTDAATGWTLVRDDTAGASGVLSVFTFQSVPATGVILPVVERTVLQSIAATLVGQPQLEDGKAHVSLEFVRQGAPLAGVTVIDVAGLGSAITAYDTGAAGAYSDQSASTDVAGRVLFLNGAASDTPTGATINVLDADGLPFSVIVEVRSDTLTLGGFEI